MEESGVGGGIVVGLLVGYGFAQEYGSGSWIPKLVHKYFQLLAGVAGAGSR